MGHYLQAEATYDDGATPEDNPDTANVDESKTKASAETRFVVAAEDYDNVAPEFLDSEGMGTTTATRMIDENSPTGTNVGLTIEATDLDVNGNQENLSYEILERDDYQQFTIVEGTGQIRVGSGDQVPFEYEDDSVNPDHRYTVTVRATDPSGLHTGSDNVDINDIEVTIVVVDLPEDPVIGDESANDNLNRATRDYEENMATSALVSLYTATDDDDDFEELDEPDKDLKWDLEGTDKDDFTIATSSDPTRQELRFKESPNYEKPTDANRDNTYSVTVVVTDSHGSTDMRDLVVTVMNLDEDGTITLSNLQPEAGIPIAATLEDPDGGVTGVTWQWLTATTATAEGSPIPGTEATMQSYTPLEVHATGNGLFLKVEATYKDNASVDNPDTQDTDESIHSTSTSSAHRVQAMDDMNETPQFTDQDPNTLGKQTTREVSEEGEVDNNGDPGEVGPAVLASDEAQNGVNGDILTYTLGGPDAGSFDIGEDSGLITVAAGVDLDYEAPKNSYTVVVTATDPSLATDEITVTIEVMDIDETPVVTQVEQLRVRCDMTEVPFEENQTGTVARCTASVPDGGGMATWSRSGPDSSVFSISSNGVLSIDSQLDYEPHSDANGDNTYEVRVTATSDGMSRHEDVEVTLVNVDEPGMVSISPDQPPYRVGDVLSASLDDGDDETVTGWQWMRSTTSGGSFTAIGGANDDTYTIVEADVDRLLQVIVTYDDPLGTGKSLPAQTTAAVLAASTAGTPGSLVLTPTSQLTLGRYGDGHAHRRGQPGGQQLRLALGEIRRWLGQLVECGRDNGKLRDGRCGRGQLPSCDGHVRRRLRHRSDGGPSRDDRPREAAHVRRERKRSDREERGN